MPFYLAYGLQSRFVTERIFLITIFSNNRMEQIWGVQMQREVRQFWPVSCYGVFQFIELIFAIFCRIDDGFASRKELVVDYAFPIKWIKEVCSGEVQ